MTKECTKETYKVLDLETNQREDVSFIVTLKKEEKRKLSTSIHPSVARSGKRAKVVQQIKNGRTSYSIAK